MNDAPNMITTLPNRTQASRPKRKVTLIIPKAQPKRVSMPKKSKYIIHYTKEEHKKYIVLSYDIED